MLTTPQVTFRGISHSDWLEGEIRDRLEQLTKFYDGMSGCRVLVEFAERHHEQGNRFHIRIALTVPGTKSSSPTPPTLTSRSKSPSARHSMRHVASCRTTHASSVAKSNCTGPCGNLLRNLATGSDRHGSPGDMARRYAAWCADGWLRIQAPPCRFLPAMRTAQEHASSFMADQVLMPGDDTTQRESHHAPPQIEIALLKLVQTLYQAEGGGCSGPRSGQRHGSWPGT